MYSHLFFVLPFAAVTLSIRWKAVFCLRRALLQDCWVSFFHKVFDLTPLLQQNHGESPFPPQFCAM